MLSSMGAQRGEINYVQKLESVPCAEGRLNLHCRLQGSQQLDRAVQSTVHSDNHQTCLTLLARLMFLTRLSQEESEVHI